MSKHINYRQRVQIETLLKEGYTQSYIAEKTGVSQSAISREIVRNTNGKEWYLADRAHERALLRSFNQRRKAPLKSYEIWEYVRWGLEKKKWTPEVVAGRLKLKKGKSLSVQAIYQWLHRLPNPQKASLTKHLPYFNKRRRRKYQNGTKFLSPEKQRRIDNRPKEVEARAEIGHWETDNMGGKKGDKSSVSVTVERSSRYVIAGKLKDLRSSSKTIHLKQRLKAGKVLTLTADNGSENAGYRELEESLKVDYYFCNPYHSWEKGSVENVIGWMRRYVPKGTSLDTLSRQKLAAVAKRYNTTPKKCLNWLTPEEVFVDNLTPQDYAFPG